MRNKSLKYICLSKDILLNNQGAINVNIYSNYSCLYLTTRGSKIVGKKMYKVLQGGSVFAIEILEKWKWNVWYI